MLDLMKYSLLSYEMPPMLVLSVYMGLSLSEDLRWYLYRNQMVSFFLFFI